jgi:hypothetical protein
MSQVYFANILAGETIQIPKTRPWVGKWAGAERFKRVA